MLFGKKRNRTDAQINAGSMADIAFLLLIFFLVTTKLDLDKGISVVLPPWSPDQEQIDIEIEDRNAFVVLLNSKDQLLVENEITIIKELKNKAKKFINNKGKDPTSSDSPQAAVISFRGDRGTSYDKYIAVYNELRAAYNELRDENSRKLYGKTYEELATDDTIAYKRIKRMYPLRLSEAEPVDFSTQ